MAGAIDLATIKAASAGTALDVTGLAGSAAGAAAVANPWLGAASLVFSALSGSTINKSGAGASAFSGEAFFGAENEQSYHKPLLDLSSPVGVILASGLVVAGIWAYKKYYKG